MGCSPMAHANPSTHPKSICKHGHTNLGGIGVARRRHCLWRQSSIFLCNSRQSASRNTTQGKPAITTIALREDPTAVAALVTWITSQGGFIHPSLRLVDQAPCGARGVIAHVPITEQELELTPLISVPHALYWDNVRAAKQLSAWLTGAEPLPIQALPIQAQTSQGQAGPTLPTQGQGGPTLSGPLTPEAAEGLLEELTATQQLALALAIERRRGSESPWQPFLASLPSVPPSPWFLPRDEVAGAVAGALASMLRPPQLPTGAVGGAALASMSWPPQQQQGNSSSRDEAAAAVGGAPLVPMLRPSQLQQDSDGGSNRSDDGAKGLDGQVEGRDWSGPMGECTNDGTAGRTGRDSTAGRTGNDGTADRTGSDGTAACTGDGSMQREWEAAVHAMRHERMAYCREAVDHVGHVMHVDMDDMLWSMAQIDSRALGSGSASGLLPFVDLLNHHADSRPPMLQLDDNDQLVMTVTSLRGYELAPMAAGDELCINYTGGGTLTALEMFLKFGFVASDCK